MNVRRRDGLGPEVDLSCDFRAKAVDSQLAGAAFRGWRRLLMRIQILTES